MHTIFFLLFQVLFVFLNISYFAESTSQNGTEEGTSICSYIIRNMIQTKLFAINGTALPTTSRAFTNVTSTSSQKECVLELKNVNISFLRTRTLVYFFICMSPLNLILDIEGVPAMPHNILYLQVYHCLMRQSEVAKLESLYDLRVLSYFATVPSAKVWSGDDQLDNTNGIDNVVAYTIIANNYSTSLPWILTTNRTFPTMGELSIVGVGLKDVPLDMHERFPNLQTLELPMNRLTVIPDFPYTENTYKLPLGLSRTPNMQDHYANSLGIKVKPDYFRRMLVLDNNFITSFPNNCISGTLTMLSLNSNGLVNISDHAFANLSGLSSVSLIDNSLSSLDEKPFSYCKDLHQLYLNNNSISWIHPDAFRNNTKLLKLDLSFNSLTSLEPGTFATLEKLELLKLDHNDIRYIPNTVLPMSSVVLREVSFRNNSLESLPIFFFLIRGLRKVDLSHCKIKINMFINILDLIPESELIDSCIPSASSSNLNIYSKPEKQRYVDLTNNRIRRLDFSNFNIVAMKKLLLILINFKLDLKDNPIECDCHLISLLDYFASPILEMDFNGSEYFYHEWLCDSPSDFKGRPILSLKKEELYCIERVLLCPNNCVCYRRYVSKRVIVDCRNRSLTSLPVTLPTGELELWLQFNNISELSKRDYLPQVRVLNMAKNSISTLNILILKKMNNLEQAFFDGNLLTTLPSGIQKLNFKLLSINNNHFICDCTNLWLKEWLWTVSDRVPDRLKIVCSTSEDKVQYIISVSDSKFICIDNFNKTLTLGLSLGIAILVLLTIMFLLFHYRLEVKVLMYVYLNFHPFDRDPSRLDDDKEPIDTLVVYSKSLFQWASKNITEKLETLRFNVLDINRDFLIGMSFRENMRLAVTRSKRSIIILSQESFDDQFVQMALTFTYEKVLRERPTYIVLFLHNINKKKIKNKDFTKYLSSGRYIETNDRMLRQKMLYMLTGSNLSGSHEILLRRKKSYKLFFPEIMYTDSLIEQKEYDLFISYPDRDYQFATGPLFNALQSRGYRICLPDRDFLVGSPKEENILEAIERSTRTLILITKCHSMDEWQLFTLRAAIERSLKETTNYLLCILDTGVDINKLDMETKAFLNSHVVIHQGDPMFWDKLFRSIPPAHKVKKGLFLETSRPSIDSDIHPLNDKPNVNNSVR